MKTLYWVEHSPNEVRIWREDWLSDQFEVWTKEEFEDFEAKAKRFGIRCVEWIGE